MNLKNRSKVYLNLIKGYMFKCTFMLEKIMKYICNKLGYENHHIFEHVIKKKSYIFLLEPIW